MRDLSTIIHGVIDGFLLAYAVAYLWIHYVAR